MRLVLHGGGVEPLAAQAGAQLRLVHEQRARPERLPDCESELCQDVLGGER